MQVPGTADEQTDDDTPVEGGQCRTFRSVVARGNYLAQDRPDVRYTVKELCRKMSKPMGSVEKGLPLPPWSPEDVAERS